MTRRRPSWGADDAGAIALMFAILLTCMCIVVGIVVDIGMLRVDRRIDRSASDMGAVSGAASLNTLDPNSPGNACRTAFDYVKANLPDTSGMSVVLPGCVSLNGSCVVGSSPAKTATGTIGPYTVAITYPVPDANPAMTQPDVLPAGTPPQTTVTATDGTSCQRLAVQVTRKRGFGFAVVVGLKGSSTTVHSVARSEIAGFGNVLAPLVALDPTSCNDIVASGQGGITVLANQDDPANTYPGAIAADSDAMGGSSPNDCTVGNSYVYFAGGSGNSPNGYIHALATSDGKAAAMYSYAMIGPGYGLAYQPGATAGCSPTATSMAASIDLCPQPQALSQRITRNPWDQRYNCKTSNGCSGKPPYIDNLVASLGGAAVPAGFVSYPKPTSSNKFCGGGNQPDFTPDPGDTLIYINCASWKITANYAFPAGVTIVTKGEIQINGSGCLVIGTTAAGPLCSSPPTATGSSVNATADSTVFIRGKGDLTRDSGASFYAFRTFVYQTGTAADTSGRLNVKASGSGNLYWTAPTGAVSWGDFSALAYWSETGANDNSPMFIGGQAGLYLAGIMFMPNAKFEFHGDGGEAQIRAQFVANRLLSSGQGNLDLTPDKTRMLPVPIIGVHLIR